MYKYRVQYAHADVRPTNGELTEDSPKGWATVDVDVDHEIVSQADIDEVTKRIAYMNPKDDGTLRYTSVGIASRDSIELLEYNGFDNDTDFEAVLYPSDFVSDSGVEAIVLGDDNYLAAWGHSVTEQEMADRTVALLAAQDALSEDVVAEEVVAAVLERGVIRTYAKALDRDPELSLSWFWPKDSGAYPVTIVNLNE